MRVAKGLRPLTWWDVLVGVAALAAGILIGYFLTPWTNL